MFKVQGLGFGFKGSGFRFTVQRLHVSRRAARAPLEV
jgi:hypothetical protein